MRRTSMALLVVAVLFTATSAFAGDCGDVNNSGNINALDVTYLINYLYKHGLVPNPLRSGDVNNSGTVNALDITYLINYLYKHGPAPNCPNEVPALTTASVSAITQTTAQCGGNITSDGGAAITVRGVCWSTDPTPTVADNKTTDGAGTGSFTSSITGLTGKTTYYVAAYAINSVGTGYGSITSFTTTDSMGTVTDEDGNSYRTIKIGNQWWMAENLKVTHYRNGDTIPDVTDDATWGGLTTGAYCEYDNDINNVATYGRLYNWYAVNDSRNIAPEGWHVPSNAEWQTLADYLGGYLVAGGKMKETGTSHWMAPNYGATNESGFSALPGGERDLSPYWRYISMGYSALFWPSMEDTYLWGLHYDHSNVICYTSAGFDRKRPGLSVRCVKD